ncbi:MAG: DegV family EDD domain-containing protein [Asgard group archaeon]|nr:DegV family EDD domain-containing protein [Asgard group archaeon]
MSEKMKSFSLYCPFCKDVLTFQLNFEELKKRMTGGLTGIQLPEHGHPAHGLEVYIDTEGFIRGAYPIIDQDTTKYDSYQNYYITDATSEITPEQGNAVGVKVLPFTITIDDGPQKNYNEEVYFPEIYDNLKLDKRVKSQPVPAEAFLKAFEDAPKNKPIIVLVVSKRYSEGYNNAIQALKILKVEQPNLAKNIHIIDTKTTGPFMKLMMNEILQMDEEGKSTEEILAHLKWSSESHVSYIYVDSLNALRKSERVGRVTTFFGNLLGLKPVIIENDNNNGDLKAFKTVRSKEQSIQEIAKDIKNRFEGKELVGVIFYGIVIDDAIRMQEVLNLNMGIELKNFTTDFIGTGVAIHLSYDLLGISLYPKK